MSRDSTDFGDLLNAEIFKDQMNRSSLKFADLGSNLSEGS